MTDSARLTWLIAQGPPGAADGMGLNGETWEVSYGMPRASDSDQHAVREAIDAAMSAETKGTPDQSSGVLTVKCPFCGRPNVFPCFSSVSVFICDSCGEPVGVEVIKQ